MPTPDEPTVRPRVSQEDFEAWLGQSVSASRAELETWRALARQDFNLALDASERVWYHQAWVVVGEGIQKALDPARGGKATLALITEYATRQALIMAANLPTYGSPTGQHRDREEMRVWAMIARALLDGELL